MKNLDLKSIKFKEANRKLMKPDNMTDEECSSLWVFNDGIQNISCWKVPFIKRLGLIFHGKVWISILSGHTQPPCWVDVNKTVFKSE